MITKTVNVLAASAGSGLNVLGIDYNSDCLSFRGIEPQARVPMGVSKGAKPPLMDRAGFEPAASPMPREHDTRFRHRPNKLFKSPCGGLKQFGERADNGLKSLLKKSFNVLARFPLVDSLGLKRF